MEKLTFEELSNFYQNKNHGCGNIKSYSPRFNKMTEIGCNQWSCKKCRPKKTQELYELVLMSMYRYDLTRHLVITFPGKKERSEYNYEETYTIMNHDWKNFIKALKYRLETTNQLQQDFAYIKLPRAQQDGVCHHHVLLNQWIPQTTIKEIIKNNKYTFGYLKINYNEDLADYLRDFKKDREYYIPPQLKHYSTSRNIIVNPGQGYESNPENLIIRNMTYEQIDELINKKYNQVAPWEIYVKWFHDTIDKPRKPLSGKYLNGELKEPSVMYQ